MPQRKATQGLRHRDTQRRRETRQQVCGFPRLAARHGQDLLRRIRSEPKSKSPIYIACGGVDQVPILFLFQYFDLLNTVQQKLGAWFDVGETNTDRHVAGAVFELRAKNDTVMSVANLDDCIEIVNGPSLTVSTSIQPLRLLKAPAQPSGRVTTAAVRANAIVELPSEKVGPIVIERFQLNRLYRIGVGVGLPEPSIIVGSRGADPVTVGTALLSELQKKAKRLVMAGWTAGQRGIVISPIVRMTRVLVRVLGPSENAFFLKIGDPDPDPVDGTGLSVSEIRDELFEKAEKAGKDILCVEAVGEDGLLLQGLEIGTTAERRKFTVAVLNEDRAIELVDAPALTVRTYDLKINCPEKEFVVLRNDAEFFITVPGQWASRPGLVRNSDEIPLGYKKLSADFGDRNPEIYYGTSRDCLLFKNWVPAGTYMATYTRMTTMEAANEFGRHAAATVIQKLLELAKRDMRGQPLGLVANFPQIWRVEDNEPPDLRFAKQLDKALCDANLPHVLDILGVTGAVDQFLESDILESGFLKSNPVAAALRRAGDTAAVARKRDTVPDDGARFARTPAISALRLSSAIGEGLGGATFRPRLTGSPLRFRSRLCAPVLLGSGSAAARFLYCLAPKPANEQHAFAGCCGRIHRLRQRGGEIQRLDHGKHACYAPGRLRSIRAVEDCLRRLGDRVRAQGETPT